MGLDVRQSLILQGVRTILRPLVRLCLGYGVTYTMLLEELKRLFVDVAASEFQLQGREQTDSRITLLTGVHRKDVRRIRDDGDSTLPVKPNLPSLVLSRWLGSDTFTDAESQPLPLRKTIADGGNASFEALVASVSKDIRSKSLLDEWLAGGLVQIDDDGWIRLDVDAFLPHGDFERTAGFLAMNVSDHLAAAVANIRADTPPFFERAAFSDGLSVEQVRALQAFVKTEGMAFLRRMNREHIRLDAVSKTSGVRYRVNTGVYFYAETQNDDNL